LTHGMGEGAQDANAMGGLEAVEEGVVTIEPN
jgi:hypothetical protein